MPTSHGDLICTSGASATNSKRIHCPRLISHGPVINETCPYWKRGLLMLIWYFFVTTRTYLELVCERFQLRKQYDVKTSQQNVPIDHQAGASITLVERPVGFT